MCCNDAGQDKGVSSYIAYYWYEQMDLDYTMKFTAIQCLNLHIQANKSLKVLYSNVTFITVECFRKKIAKHSLSSSTIVICHPTLSLNFATLKCTKNHGKYCVKCVLAGYLHTLYNINVIVFGQLEQESIDTLCECDLIYIIKKKEDAKPVYVDVKLEGVEHPESITIRLSTSI